MWLAVLLALLLGGLLFLTALTWARYRQGPRKDHAGDWDRMISKMMRIRKIQSAYHEHGEWLKQFDAEFRELIQVQWRHAKWKHRPSLYKYT